MNNGIITVCIYLPYIIDLSSFKNSLYTSLKEDMQL